MVLVLDAINSLLGAMILIKLVRLILILVLWTGCKFGCSVWWLVLCIFANFCSCLGAGRWVDGRRYVEYFFQQWNRVRVHGVRGG